MPRCHHRAYVKHNIYWQAKAFHGELLDTTLRLSDMDRAYVKHNIYWQAKAFHGELLDTTLRLSDMDSVYVKHNIYWQAKAFHGELLDTTLRLSDMDSQLITAKPVGGLPETARGQLDSFTVSVLMSYYMANCASSIYIVNTCIQECSLHVGHA